VNGIKHISWVNFALLGKQVAGLLHQVKATAAVVLRPSDGVHPAISLVHFALVTHTARELLERLRST
jgi:hypothetical protein